MNDEVKNTEDDILNSLVTPDFAALFPVALKALTKLIKIATNADLNFLKALQLWGFSPPSKAIVKSGLKSSLFIGLVIVKI